LTKKHFIHISSLIIILSLTWIILTPLIFPSSTTRAETTAPQQGFIAPDFTLSTPEGESITLSDFHGRPVLIFFWASWCSVCKKIMPDIQTVYEEYKTKGFEVLAVNTTNQDSLPNALETFNTKGYDFQLLLDNAGSVSETYRVYALPTAFLIGADGYIQDVSVGSGLSEGYLRALLSKGYQDAK